MLVTNPKRVNKSDEINLYWNNYYAGYSPTFTNKIITSSDLNESSIILDPWNGSGTATFAASISGFHSIGIDLNPVMKIIAKAKQATISDVEITIERLESFKLAEEVATNIHDPLNIWFDNEGVIVLRKIERTILGNIKCKSTIYKVNSLDVSQCLMYTALFNSVREYLKPFISSNPTWIRKPGSDVEKISINMESFESKYRSFLQHMVEKASLVEHTCFSGLSELVIGSSSKIPFRDEYVDLVLTSPPYCTRIDYGVATLPELAIVAVEGRGEIDSIRRRLMGTTTVPKSANIITEEYGPECLTFLDLVKTHQSKASRTYYYKNFCQYFLDLKESVGEISRVLKRKCRAVCVVQNSFYKDIHCDLSRILTEMAILSGLNLVDKADFEVKKNMANVNTRSRPYRAANIVFETVLTLEK